MKTLNIEILNCHEEVNIIVFKSFDINFVFVYIPPNDLDRYHFNYLDQYLQSTNFNKLVLFGDLHSRNIKWDVKNNAKGIKLNEIIDRYNLQILNIKNKIYLLQKLQRECN